MGYCRGKAFEQLILAATKPKISKCFALLGEAGGESTPFVRPQSGDGYKLSQVLEMALQPDRNVRIQEELERFYSKHEETEDEEYAADVAQINLDAAMADD